MKKPLMKKPLMKKPAMKKRPAMKKLDRIYIRSLTAMLAVAGMMWTLSCSDNDGVATLSGPLPVRLHVSADMLGDLNSSRAAGGDDNAESGEFMNTLCVFVVNANNVIEAKFGPDILDMYEAAQTGDLTDWTSDELTLTVGEKTVYAFANWNNTESTEWAALIAKDVGDEIDEENDLYFTVDDPASKVDIENGSYIPMSGKATATIGEDLNYSDQLISVGLDRLVGKVTIAVNGDASANVTLGDFTFTGWADKVPLMSDDETEYTSITYEEGYKADLSTVTISANAQGVQIASFYVNETYRPETTDGYDGFEITLVTDQYEGLTYTATTARTEIPRNCIYPILLTLDTYELVLTPQAWTSILGVDAEVEYTSPITFANDTYYITMLEVTSTFSITPSLLRNGTETVSSVSWAWTYVDENGRENEVGTTASEGAMPACTVNTNGVLNVTTLTATPGYEYGFTLVGEWTADSGATLHSRTYNVKVVFTEGFPSLIRASRAWWSRSYGSELLRLKLRE